MTGRKATIDDGFNHELVEGARFDGILEIPCIEKPSKIIIPEGFTPFSKAHRAPTALEALSFFEFDTKFSQILISPSAFLDTARRFAVFIPPDCSIYRDQPLATQIANIYRSRAIGVYFQRHGANVYPLIRWGDERTYTNSTLPEPVAFLGAPRGGIVTVSTYGCIRSSENKKHFQAGIEAMIHHLTPQVVLVHGAMPPKLFSHVRANAEFIQFPDWISRMKGGK